LKYITDPESLEFACKKISASPWTAVDTEADSLHHYIEKLCLVQVSIVDEDYVIDPLTALELGPLVRILEKKELLLHGSDFDLRILKRFYQFSPPTVFDTMVAAQLLGYEKQGFADLADRHCEVKLSKKAQRADWAERPLSEELLTYAANDTHYLKLIADKMKQELKDAGRLEWHRPKFRPGWNGRSKVQKIYTLRRLRSCGSCGAGARRKLGVKTGPLLRCSIQIRSSK
jgi:ribonuclease D